MDLQSLSCTERVLWDSYAGSGKLKVRSSTIEIWKKSPVVIDLQILSCVGSVRASRLVC